MIRLNVIARAFLLGDLINGMSWTLAECRKVSIVLNKGVITSQPVDSKFIVGQAVFNLFVLILQGYALPAMCTALCLCWRRCTYLSVPLGRICILAHVFTQSCIWYTIPEELTTSPGCTRLVYSCDSPLHPLFYLIPWWNTMIYHRFGNCFLSLTKWHHTPCSRPYSDLVDDWADFVCTPQLTLKSCSKAVTVL